MANTKQPKHTRSIRTTDHVWNRAKERAEAESSNVSRVTEHLLEGYACGFFNIPSAPK